MHYGLKYSGRIFIHGATIPGATRFLQLAVRLYRMTLELAVTAALQSPLNAKFLMRQATRNVSAARRDLLCRCILIHAC